MSKKDFVIATIAKVMGINKKEIKRSVELFLFHGASGLDGFSVMLDSGDTQKFLRKIEKEYGVFFPGNEATEFVTIKHTVKAISKKLDEAKAKQKAEKDQIPNFVYDSSGVNVMTIGNDGSYIMLLSQMYHTDPAFWQNFDKWYSSNRKKVLKKYKPAKVKKAKKPIKDDAPIVKAA